TIQQLADVIMGEEVPAYAAVVNSMDSLSGKQRFQIDAVEDLRTAHENAVDTIAREDEVGRQLAITTDETTAAIVNQTAAMMDGSNAIEDTSARTGALNQALKEQAG